MRLVPSYQVNISYSEQPSFAIHQPWYQFTHSTSVPPHSSAIAHSTAAVYIWIIYRLNSPAGHYVEHFRPITTHLYPAKSGVVTVSQSSPVHSFNPLPSPNTLTKNPSSVSLTKYRSYYQYRYQDPHFSLPPVCIQTLKLSSPTSILTHLTHYYLLTPGLGRRTRGVKSSVPVY